MLDKLKTPSLPNVFRTGGDKNTSPAGNSTNGASPSAPASNLPRHLEQNGSKKFAKFKNFIKNSNTQSSNTRAAQTAERSATTPEPSADIGQARHQRRLKLAEKMVQDATAKIDLCTKIDWESYASKDAKLAHHVRGLQNEIETHNANLKAQTIALIRKMPDEIRQELEAQKPAIEEQAKDETKKRWVEKSPGALRDL